MCTALLHGQVIQSHFTVSCEVCFLGMVGSLSANVLIRHHMNGT